MADLDLTCGHCGTEKSLEHKENVILERRSQELQNWGEIEWVTVASIYRCGACKELTVDQYIWADEVGESFADRRLFPTKRDNSAVPARVRERLTQALRVKRIEPDFYAVGIRKMLETVCNEEGATGSDLFEMLDDLAAKDRIPRLLADVAHELRKLGNLGAHDETVSVSSEEVPPIEDLADAILEFLYRAPAKLAAVQAGLEERRNADQS